MAKTTTTTAETKRIHELEDALKDAEKRIAELKLERDEALDLVERQNQHVEDADAVIESWIEVDRLELDDNGLYSMALTAAFELDELQAKHRDLLHRWNRFVGEYNALVKGGRDPGRPLGATEAQVKRVLQLRAEGTPYRLIVDEVKPLSLQTVRTIIGRQNRTDRTTRKRMKRLGLTKEEIDRSTIPGEKARKRARDALPGQIKATLAEGAALVKEAKGIGKGLGKESDA